MREPAYRLTFGIVESDNTISIGTEKESERISFTIDSETDSLFIGEFNYRSDPRFGSSTETTNHILFDKESQLMAVATQHDNPKGSTLIRTLNDAFELSITAPDPSPEKQYELYLEHGFGSSSNKPNGYTISFKENKGTYEIVSEMGRTVDPEDEAKERAMYSSETIGDDMVHEIAQEAMDNNMNIWSADLYIEDENISFSAPLSLIGISVEYVENNGFEKFFELSRSLIS